MRFDAGDFGIGEPVKLIHEAVDLGFVASGAKGHFAAERGQSNGNLC